MSITTALRLRRLEAAAVPRLRAFAASPEMLAIRSALPYSFGGLAVGLGVFMWAHAGSFLQRFAASFAPAFGIMSMTLVVLLTIDLAKRRSVSPPLALAGSCCAFALSLPPFHSGVPESLFAALGSSGLFLAIGLALLSVDSIVVLRQRFGPRAGGVAGVLAPIVLAGALRVMGFSLTGALDALIAPLGGLGDSLAALLIITLVETLLWTVGIHGPALLAAVVLPVYLRLQFENTAALAHGAPLPHIVTVSTFLFIFPGGAGATLPLVLFLLRSPRKRDKRVAYATLLPSVLNANEPLMFGLPVVLNPYLGIPFVLAPVTLALVTWEAMNLGFVGRPAYYIPSTVPLPLSVFFATRNDWRAVVLIATNVLLAAAVYFPFVRMYARSHRGDEA